MDVYDQHWSRVGLFGPHGTRAGVARVAQEKANLVACNGEKRVNFSLCRVLPIQSLQSTRAGKI